MTKALKFWGTRGSCAVSGPEYVYFGGNTPCLEVCYDDTLVVIDAGTGIRPFGETLQDVSNIDLFLSHMHWDHLIGFPFFEPIYRKDVKITIWAPQGNGRKIHDLFDQLLGKEFFPIHLDQIQASIEFKVIEEKKPIQIGSLNFDFHRTRHPGPTLSFKINTPHQSIGYVTDNEIKLDEQESFIDFYKGVDLFIHEAQYSPEEYSSKTGWGHSSTDSAASLINKIIPGQWLVTHHDPKHSDEMIASLETHVKNQPLPCPVEWVRDGHVFILN